MTFSLEQYDIHVHDVIRNASPAVLYGNALRYEPGTAIADNGALIAMSGEKTGRSPTDKRIVDEPTSHDDVWWGDVNMKVTEHTFMINRERALDYLNTCDRLYVVDGFAGWDPAHRIKVRIITTRAYHALFMHNMLIRPTPDQLSEFGDPDYVVFNSGEFSANRYTEGMSSKTSVALHFGRKEMVILGTQYAGEMKKGVFTIMHYLMPRADVLSMHCSANVDQEGEVSIFFGLSGTGKTTLSADPGRNLIGDDEHCWTETGIFNIEGGCYAKAIHLDADKEPDIYNAIRFGSVLENVVYDASSHAVDYDDSSITQNTRCSYPIEFIDNAIIPCMGAHPSNVIFLTADAFGVLPPVARLTPEQAMYHFISGYTAKVAGTEMGVDEPEATFSACFGAPFLVWHPARYAELLAAKIAKHHANVWLVNTGWTGGPYGVGHRMPISHSRAIIDGIHSGALADAPTVEDPLFGFRVPTSCPGVPSEVLLPRNTWHDKGAYDTTAKQLAGLFQKNFTKFEDGASDAIKMAGPRL